MALRKSISFKESNPTEKEMYDKLDKMIDTSIYVKKAIKFYMDYEEGKIQIPGNKNITENAYDKEEIKDKEEEDNLSKLDLRKFL